MTRSSAVNVVVVTYNSARDIEECIETLRASSTNVALKIIVLDNNSSDNTSEIVERMRDERKIDVFVKNHENVGFARAVNRGLVEAGPGPVLLLNPDARLDDDALEILVAESTRLPNSGVLSPLVYSGDSVHTITAGRQPRLWPMITHFSGLSRMFQGVPLFRGRYLHFGSRVPSTAVRVEWVAGCCMFLTERALSTIGGLSERWFMYAEDTEYCQRALDHDLEVWLIPSARCYHAMGASVKSSQGPVNTMWPRSLTDYYRTQFEPDRLTFTTWRIVFSLGLLSRAVVFWLRDRKSRGQQSAGESRRFVAFAGAVWRD